MKVLLAIDDSICSRYLVDVVRKRRWPAKTKFKLITVIEPIVLGESIEQELEEDLKDVSDTQMQHASQLCERVKRKLEHEILASDIECEIREGLARAEIVDSAQEWGADKIVIGTHGRSVCPHNMLGSVSRSVVRHAPCSVEVVKPTTKKSG